MELITAKVIAMVVLGGVSLMVGLVPLMLKRCCAVGSSKGKGSGVISALSCFGGGVILSTCLGHMLPEVNLMLTYNIQSGEIPDYGKIYILLFFIVFAAPLPISILKYPLKN